MKFPQHHSLKFHLDMNIKIVRMVSQGCWEIKKYLFWGGLLHGLNNKVRLRPDLYLIRLLASPRYNF